MLFLCFCGFIYLLSIYRSKVCNIKIQEKVSTPSCHPPIPEIIPVSLPSKIEVQDGNFYSNVYNYIEEVEGSMNFPSDLEEVNNISNVEFIQENFRPYFVEEHQPNLFVAQLPNNCQIEILKFDMQTKIIFREFNSQFSFNFKDPFNFVNDMNMEKFTKKILDYGRAVLRYNS
jgi:hypothetical protein